MTSNVYGGKTIGLISGADDQLQAFLRDFVASYEELEALLLLAQDESRAWGEAEVAASLNATAESIAEALQRLAAAGKLVRVTERAGNLVYRYAPANEASRAGVVALRRAYDEQRLSVVRMMSANALDRVRGAAMRRLADAFRIERSRK